MATLTKIGYGIALKHATTIGGSYTDVGAELLDITAPAPTVEAVKVMRSDNSAAVIEKVGGWTDYSAAEATVTYTAGNRVAIEALLNVAGFFKVVYPPVGSQTVGDSEIFAGYISKIGKETPLKDAMKVKISIECNGAGAFTAGS